MQAPITPPPQTSILLGEEVEDDSILIWNSAGVDWWVMIVVLTRDVVQSTHSIIVYVY